jgi:hypothetical protein
MQGYLLSYRRGNIQDGNATPDPDATDAEVYDLHKSAFTHTPLL